MDENTPEHAAMMAHPIIERIGREHARILDAIYGEADPETSKEMLDTFEIAVRRTPGGFAALEEFGGLAPRPEFRC